MHGQVSHTSYCGRTVRLLDGVCIAACKQEMIHASSWDLQTFSKSCLIHLSLLSTPHSPAFPTSNKKFIKYAMKGYQLQFRLICTEPQWNRHQLYLCVISCVLWIVEHVGLAQAVNLKQHTNDGSKEGRDQQDTFGTWNICFTLVWSIRTEHNTCPHPPHPAIKINNSEHYEYDLNHYHDIM